MLYFVTDEATVGLGDDMKEAETGTCDHMPLARSLPFAPEEQKVILTFRTLPPHYWAAFVLSGDWR